MSEYQYYEFQAVDRPLDETDRKALRALSTRARITATSFTNSYEWGDFKGNSAALMDRMFDLHLYWANWGTRRLMIRLPRRLVDDRNLDVFLAEVDEVAIRPSGDNWILDITRDEVEPDDEWDDGSGWLAALAPLRADLLAGDRRLFYLLWLIAVEAGAFEDDMPEPTPGIGPMSGALQAFADFCDLDPDLIAAAAERDAEPQAASADSARATVAAMPNDEKAAMLLRLIEGDPHVAAELRARARHRPGGKAVTPANAARSVGDLRSRAEQIRRGREQAAAERQAAERRRRADAAEIARRQHLDAVARRGESVWQDIDREIERRNASGYDKATGLLLDLHTIAETRGTGADFAARLRVLRERHERKTRLIERLTGLG